MAEPIINGVQYDHGSIELRVGAKVYTAIKEISYSTKIERGMLRGTSPRKRGRTRGVKDDEASITWFRTKDGGFDEFLADHGHGYMEVEFDIVVTFGKNGQPTTTDTIKGCKLAGAENSSSEGSDPLEVKTDLDVMDIELGGLRPLAD